MKKHNDGLEQAKLANEAKILEGFDAAQSSAGDTCKKLEVDPTKGLSEKEAQKRLTKFGPNKLIEKKKESVLQMFFGEFKDPLVIILLVAALINAVFAIINNVTGSADVEDWAEVAVILAIVLLNATIGTVQEAKASKALEALKKMSSPTCTVKRDGKLKSVKAEEVVLGDVVILEEGTIVPADIRLTVTHNLKSDEASLTGESVPAEKDSKAILKGKHSVGDEINIAHSSCPVSYGRGEGVVVATSMNTQIGKIAGMLQGGDEQTPLQKKLAQLGKIMSIICIVIVVAMFVVGIAWLIPDMINGTVTGNSIKSLFMQAIALAVAAIPEGLPAIVTIVLAMGVSRMVKVNTIVRKLPSVETLGSVTVVCSDKTGTLTQNRMTIKKVYANKTVIDADKVDLQTPELLLLTKGMMLDSNASINGDRYGDPTELALLDFAKTFNIEKEQTEAEVLPRLDELPFDSVRKMMSTLHDVKDVKDNAPILEQVGKKHTIIFTKGALDSILANTTRILENGSVKKISPDNIYEINKAAKELASQAYRVLAFAVHHNETDEVDEKNLVFVGLMAMIDPPRAEAKPAVAKFHRAGIATIMITGDHADTALAIGRELGIANSENQTMTGAQIDVASPEELSERVKTIRIFARVSPANKVAIVKALKDNGNIVAMTGDGVNDAPSLKAADVGIAMGITGTDVAKGAADMVLADDNFASIEKAVEEGRSIFTNIKKTIFYLLSSNFAEILIMFLATCAHIIQPLSAMQLLWINLITDSLPAIALGRDDKAPDIMNNKPRNPQDGVFAHGGFYFNLFYGFVIFVAVFGGFMIPIAIGLSKTTGLSWWELMEVENVKEILLANTGGQNWDSILKQLEDGTLQLNPDQLKAVTDSLNANKNLQGFLLENGTLNQNLIAAGVTCFEDARTTAFTTLALAEIFHMLGMSNVKRSFINVFKGKNWFFLVAFASSFVLQIAVTEIPGLTTLFTGHNRGLGIDYWCYAALLGLLPLIVHELAVPVLKNREVV